MTNKRCLVKFKLGPCEDELCCDVNPMKVTRTLLWRHWFIDCSVKSDERTNSCISTFNGKLTFDPTKIEELVKHKNLLGKARMPMKTMTKEYNVQTKSHGM